MLLISLPEQYLAWKTSLLAVTVTSVDSSETTFGFLLFRKLHHS